MSVSLILKCWNLWNRTQTVVMFLQAGCKMSWFTDLAGKAEDFLNKVDQGAATALSKNQTGTSYGGVETVKSEYNTEGAPTYASSHDSPSYISAAAGNIKRSNATLLAGSASVATVQSASGSSISNSSKTSSGFVRPKKSDEDVDDDMLFNFLNSSEPPVSTRRDSRREILKAVGPAIEAQSPSPPPPSATPYTTPSAPSTPPSTRGVSRASSMSSLSAHSIKTSEENSAKEQSQGIINKY